MLDFYVIITRVVFYVKFNFARKAIKIGYGPMAARVVGDTLAKFIFLMDDQMLT